MGCLYPAICTVCEKHWGFLREGECLGDSQASWGFLGFPVEFSLNGWDSGGVPEGSWEAFVRLGVSFFCIMSDHSTPNRCSSNWIILLRFFKVHADVRGRSR